jgi:hypothetical protein
MSPAQFFWARMLATTSDVCVVCYIIFDATLENSLNW